MCTKGEWVPCPFHQHIPYHTTGQWADIVFLWLRISLVARCHKKPLGDKTNFGNTADKAKNWEKMKTPKNTSCRCLHRGVLVLFFHVHALPPSKWRLTYPICEKPTCDTPHKGSKRDTTGLPSSNWLKITFIFHSQGLVSLEKKVRNVFESATNVWLICDPFVIHLTPIYDPSITCPMIHLSFIYNSVFDSHVTYLWPICNITLETLRVARRRVSPPPPTFFTCRHFHDPAMGKK